MDEVRTLSYAEKVAILAKMSGMSYGEYVRTHDTSKLAEKKKEKSQFICKRCGKSFTGFSHKKRTVCDDCKAERMRELNKEWARIRREQREKG